MRRECPCESAGFLLLASLQLFEELNKCVGVVSRLVHVLQAEIISLGFEAAREAEERQRQSQSRRGTNRVTNPAANEDQRNRADVCPLGTGHLTGRMASRDVRDLMRHHPSKFGLFVR